MRKQEMLDKEEKWIEDNLDEFMPAENQKELREDLNRVFKEISIFMF